LTPGGHSDQLQYEPPRQEQWHRKDVRLAVGGKQSRKGFTKGEVGQGEEGFKDGLGQVQLVFDPSRQFAHFFDRIFVFNVVVVTTVVVVAIFLSLLFVLVWLWSSGVKVVKKYPVLLMLRHDKTETLSYHAGAPDFKFSLHIH
jgi:hypothetical protein